MPAAAYDLRCGPACGCLILETKQQLAAGVIATPFMLPCHIAGSSTDSDHKGLSVSQHCLHFQLRGLLCTQHGSWEHCPAGPSGLCTMAYAGLSGVSFHNAPSALPVTSASPPLPDAWPLVPPAKLLPLPAAPRCAARRCKNSTRSAVYTSPRAPSNFTKRTSAAADSEALAAVILLRSVLSRRRAVRCA